MNKPNTVKCYFCEERLPNVEGLRDYGIHLAEQHGVRDNAVVPTMGVGPTGLSHDGKCVICGKQFHTQPGWWASEWVLQHLSKLSEAEQKRHIVQMALTRP